MESGEAEGREPRPVWVREDQEVLVDPYLRQARDGAQSIAGYLRTIRQKEVAFICVVCGAANRREQYPGPPPRYCSSACRAIGARRAAAARMRQLRARRRDPDPSV